MIRIDFLGPINKDSISLEVKTLYELKEELSKHKDLDEWLEISAIALNDSIVSSLDIALKDGDVISILPPVCGG